MRLFKLVLALLLASPIFAAAQGYVVINEILADNANKSGDVNEYNEFGNASDWIELYNSSAFDVDLTGFILLKGPVITNTAPRFVFTNSVSLINGVLITNYATIMTPGTYLRLWCDKDGTNTTGVRDFHTGFSLDKNGDTIYLLRPDGQEDHHVSFGLQITDMSLGLDPLLAYPGYPYQLCIPTPASATYPSGAEQNKLAQLGNVNELRINEWCPTNWEQFINIYNHPTDTNAPNCGHCKNDWIELYNSSTNPVALSWMDWGTQRSVYLSTNVPGVTLPETRPFPTYSYIEPLGFLRVWAIDNGKTKYDSDELDFKISHSKGDTITLNDPDFNVIQSITYPGQNSGLITWVTTNGISNGKTNFTWYTQGYMPDGETNLVPVMFPVVFTNGNMSVNKSTPGDSNFLPLTNGVYINEVLAHTDPPLQDAVEFINTSSNDVDISYYYFSNNKNRPKKYRIPSGTIIPKGGYKVLYEYQFNPGFVDTNDAFTLNSAHGDSACLYSALSNGTLTGYRRVVDFDASVNGVSFGRYTNSQGNVDFPAMSQLSLGSSITRTSPTNTASSNAFVNGPGGPNAYPLVGPVVISEIMYHPPDILDETGTNVLDNSDDEYIEIYNMSSDAVYLYDHTWYQDEGGYSGYTNRWKIRHTVEYAFPTNAGLNTSLILPPGGFLLFINFDPWEPTNGTKLASFRDKYHLPTTFTNMWGPYKGKLGNSGGTIELVRPDMRQGYPHPDAGYVPKILVEQVQYNDKAPWPTNADGRGFSLQRRFPQGYANDPTNWVAVAPSPGTHAASFTSVSRTNNTITMTFQAWANVPYTVQRTSSLIGRLSPQSSTWTTVTNVPGQPNFGIRQVSDTVPSNETRFYRVTSTPQ